MPPFHNPSKPYYHYPSSDWSNGGTPSNNNNYQNNYESNNIPGSSYPTYNSPVSSPTSASAYNGYNQNHNGGNNNYGFMDDMGYAITPSAVTNNDYNRPVHSTPARPTNHYNDYQDDGNGYGYGSYQGIEKS
jgi:hypothetical protein